MTYYNNPGNIITGVDYKGETGETYGGRFAVFSTPEYGVRAMTMDLIHDIDKGKNTIEKLIYEYAPPVENDTENYISIVCRLSGLVRDEKIHKGEIKSLVKAMIVMENGRNALDYYTDSVIEKGVGMAIKDSRI